MTGSTESTGSRPPWRSLPDLAVRHLGGSVTYANDELFAERENLIRSEPAGHDPARFGPKGKVYDGWETRRRREPGHDLAVVRLGVPGVVRGVVVDTAWFTGNFPPEASIEAAYVEGYPDPTELLATARWETLVPRSPLEGDAENLFDVDDERCWTHVRLSIYPDGGVARLRVQGEAVPDPRFVGAGGLDLAALENGGRVVGCSNWFYSSPNNLIAPDRPRSMGEGWETARRRDEGNDWVTVRLAAAGVIEVAELDTTYFVGNAPGWARLSGCDANRDDVDDPTTWAELLPRTRLRPDTRHRFRLTDAAPATHVRLDIYPDGGMARLRLLGALTSEGREAIERRWHESTSH
jgi:allantoicase